MRHFSLAVLALALSVSAPASAQTKTQSVVAAPKLPPCDSNAILLTAEPIFGVGTKTIAAACPAIANRILTYFTKHPDLSAADLVSELLHGTVTKPPTGTPTDTTTPPVITPTPVDTTKPAPIDTSKPPVTLPAAPAGYRTLINPMPGMAGLPATVFVPVGDTGWAGPKSAPGDEGNLDDFGEFRTTCVFAKASFDDPIVYPGQPGASHLHVYFGNTALDAFSTSESAANSGNSTCAGGTLNRTGYWLPAPFVPSTGLVIRASLFTAYYKNTLNADYTKIKPIPPGLRVVAGDKTWQGPGPQIEGSQGFQYVEWTCESGKVDVPYAESGHIPNCPIGDAVHLEIKVPQCWDGKNLDSPDHKSHMARAIIAGSTKNGTKCPSTHPVLLPLVSEIVTYPVTKDNAPSSAWRLSSDVYDLSKKGGFSAHADYMFAWDTTTMNQMIVKKCLNAGRNCGPNFGGGQQLIVRPDR